MDKDRRIQELEDRVVVLENELRSCREKTNPIDIVDRKRAEEALRACEERYRGLIESTGDWVWEINEDFVLTYDSPMGWKILGYGPDEVIGKDPYSFVPEAELERVKSIAGPAIERHEPIIRIEIRLIKKDGSIATVETSGIPLFDESGRYRGYRGINHDITERKRAEDALRESGERFRATFEQAAVGATHVDKDGRFLRVNRKFCDITGYSPEELVKLTIRDITYGPDLADEVLLINRLLAGELATYTREKRYVRKDGTILWVNLTVTPIFEKGMLEYLVGVTEDITERKRAEAELERANRALRAISKCNEAVIHAKEESVLLNDVCQIIVGVGRYRMAWVGYAENDAKKSVRPVACSGFEDGYMAIVNVTWEATERGRGPTGSTVRTGKPCVIRYAATDPNFLPWREDALKRGYNSVLGLPLVQDGYCLGALTIYSKKPDAFDEKEIILLQDLADNLTHGIISLRNQVKREEAERALKTAKQQAELYLDLMGHDINNMNQSAMGYLELALDTLESDGKIGLDGKLFIEKPLKAISNSSQLIENVGKLQRLMTEGIKTMPIDLHDLFEKLKAHDFHAHGKDVTINYGRVPHCMVEGNELLSDVFFNLIDNAIKHSSPVRPVTVDVSAERVDEAGQAFYRCIVEDDGPGIPDELKPRVFHRFQRGKTKAQGKGLGLYIVRTLVEGYHGKIWVEDRVPGDHTKGARFVILLPTIEK